MSLKKILEYIPEVLINTKKLYTYEMLQINVCKKEN